MNNPSSTKASPLLILKAESAADLMMANPVSINADAAVTQALAFLVEKRFSSAPVIDEAGHPLGVVSQADILKHGRARAEYVFACSKYYQRMGLPMRSGQFAPCGPPVEDSAHIRVRDIMTRNLLSVTPETSGHRVIEDMLTHKVHRLLVVDSNGILIGVISALDILRHLRSEQRKLNPPPGDPHRVQEEMFPDL